MSLCGSPLSFRTLARFASFFDEQNRNMGTSHTSLVDSPVDLSIYAFGEAIPLIFRLEEFDVGIDSGRLGHSAINTCISVHASRNDQFIHVHLFTYSAVPVCLTLSHDF